METDILSEYDVKSSKRDSYIDFVKGILTILVIIGHVLPGMLNENIARYAIYSFHMPMFFMMSGYLFKPQNVLDRKNFWHKYIRRIVVPWGIAVIVYYTVNIYVNGQTVSAYAAIRGFLRPYYHLWYVYGFLFCIMSCFVLLKIGRFKYEIGFFWGGIWGVGQFCIDMIQNNIHIIGKAFELIYYSVRPQFFLFL